MDVTRTQPPIDNLVSPSVPMFDQLAERINGGRSVVSVIGLGYVGLPLLRAVSQAGFPAIGFDIDQQKIDSLNAGKSYIRHIPDGDIAELRAAYNVAFTSDFSALKDADVIVISVPTPVTKHRVPDLQYVTGTFETVAQYLRPGQLVVLESTTYPGTTRQVAKPILDRTGLRSEYDYFLAYSPEREDPGNPRFDTRSIPKVIGGDGPLALQLADMVYGRFLKQTVRVTSADVAEAVKLTENIFRSVNIALVNELKVVYEAMGIDIWEVIEAAKTKPFGYMPFYPGPGLGGHCIPVDPFYLTWKAREYGVNTRFIELAGEVNSAMPLRVVQRVLEELDCRFTRGLRGSTVLVMGVAYKRDVDDLRESPALIIMEELGKKGANVEYYDPYVPEIPLTREHPELAGKRSISWSASNLSKFACAVIVTDHSNVDYRELISVLPLVIDTRNATAQIPAGNVVKA
jgi:UDP-N-acetyl-D-glucosamine dehydrogenase